MQPTSFADSSRAASSRPGSVAFSGFGGDRVEALRRQPEQAERQPHRALDLLGRSVAPESHARDDHGFLTRHWVTGVADLQANTVPMRCALETCRRTSSPP